MGPTTDLSKRSNSRVGDVVCCRPWGSSDSRRGELNLVKAAALDAVALAKAELPYDGVLVPFFASTDSAAGLACGFSSDGFGEHEYRWKRHGLPFRVFEAR